jgi:membrane protease subunit HflC
MRRWSWTLVLLGGLAVFGRFCLVVLDEREQAFRTLLNEPEFSAFGMQLNQPSLTEPGIYVRIPFLHQLYRYDRLQRRYDAEPRDLYTKEKQLIEVDYFAVWQIEDPRLFFETNRTYANARQRLDTVTYSELRQALALHPLADLLSERRGAIMSAIAQRSDEKLQPRGIRIRDLRIRRSDYPQANLSRILDRMRSERERFAKKARAEGEEAALEIRSRAERESQVIRAEAGREAERTRGAGDATAAEIYGRAYDQDPDFYAFTKSLEAYREAIDEETTMVLTPRSRFLRYLFRDSKPLTPVSSGSAGSPGPRREP